MEPSNLPVGLQLWRDGAPLPTKEAAGEDGVVQVALLEGVPAGSSGDFACLPAMLLLHALCMRSACSTAGRCALQVLNLALCPALRALPPAVSGLRVVLLDDSGQPAAQEVSGKLNVSWRAGCKKSTWGAQLGTASAGLKLPPCKVDPAAQLLAVGRCYWGGSRGKATS